MSGDDDDDQGLCSISQLKSKVFCQRPTKSNSQFTQGLEHRDELMTRQNHSLELKCFLIKTNY